MDKYIRYIAVLGIMLISLFGTDNGNKLGPDNREFRTNSAKRTFLFTIYYTIYCIRIRWQNLSHTNQYNICKLYCG